MISGVSEHLEKRYGVRIPPGCKGPCPFCRRNHFTIRRDDSVGKCFHPSCGRFVAAGSSRDDYRGSLYEILDKIRQDCHECLLAQKGRSGCCAYKFLTVDRLIHEDVIRDLAEIGAVPKNYDVAKAFTEAVDDAGDGMIDALSQTFTLEIVKPPQREQDIDDFIRSLPEAKQALDALQQLIGQRSLRQRPNDALAKQVFETRQKHGEEDERREFEINAQVRGIVIKDLSERGRFYHEHQQGYYFLGDEKKLIPLDDAGRQLSCLVERYGLNPSEKVFEYIREALLMWQPNAWPS